jgi:hypothetical protein
VSELTFVQIFRPKIRTTTSRLVAHVKLDNGRTLKIDQQVDGALDAIDDLRYWLERSDQQFESVMTLNKALPPAGWGEDLYDK